MIAQELEVSLHMAFVEARQKQHEFITVEHLLLAILSSPAAAGVLKACGVDLDELRSVLDAFIDEHTPHLSPASDADTQPTQGFQRVIQRAILHVQSSGKKEVTSANVLVAIFGEEKSHAVYFLNERGLTRLDVVNCIAHGIGKASEEEQENAREDDETASEGQPSLPAFERSRWMAKRTRTSRMLSLGNTKQIEAILVCDLCDSSVIADDQGDKVAHVKERLSAICDPLLSAYSANYAKNTGNGFISVFFQPTACLAAAIAILRRLGHRNSITQNPPIFVRVGMHCGETFVIDETTKHCDCNDINIAFRIESVREDEFEVAPATSLPDKNRIVVSRCFMDAFREEWSSLPTPGVEELNIAEAHWEAMSLFKPLGKAPLEGIQDPIDLYLYAWESRASWDSMLRRKIRLR